MKPSITPVGALVRRLTAALLCSAHLPLLQELSAPSSSRLNNHRLLSGSPHRRSPPPFLTLYNAQHWAQRQRAELKCHKKPIHVPNVSSRRKALSSFFFPFCTTGKVLFIAVAEYLHQGDGMPYRISGGEKKVL